MPPKTTIWPAEPHTIAKHRILAKYLQGWMPALLLGGHGRVVVIDGFCGPGEYVGGEEGSPTVALRAYLDHAHRGRMKGELVFLFIDRDRDRIEYLKSVALPRLGRLPDNVKVHIECAPFDETMGTLLDDLDERGRRLAPTFAFLDPFGFSDTPMSVIERILQHPRSEVLVTFMIEPVNRFLAHPNEKIASRYDELFGDPGWRHLLDQENRLGAIGDFYGQQLGQRAKYAWSFRMSDEGNRAVYDLFFASNHLDGLKKMKRAMWSVDPGGGYRFSDRQADQPTLFDVRPDTSRLRRGLVERFAGQTVPYSQLEEWILRQSPFHDGHIKKLTLKPLEVAGLIECLPPPWKPARRKGTYPDGCSIRFA